jgi:hypothetical protein
MPEPLPLELRTGDVVQTPGGPDMILTSTGGRNLHDDPTFSVEYKPYVTARGWKMPGIKSDTLFSRPELGALGALLVARAEVKVKSGSLLDDLDIGI